MRVDLTAKLKHFSGFEHEYTPGDEKRLFDAKPLIFAALSNNKPDARYRISSFLLDRGAIVTGQSPEGATALSILLSRQTHEISRTTELVKRLIAAGADPALRAERGVTATQLLAQLPQDDEEIQDLLEFWFAQPGLAPDAPNDFGKTPIDLAGDYPATADRVRRMKEYRG